MKILADTHAFLWFITDAPRLSKKAKALLEAPDKERFLSVASVWEMAIKSRLGKLALRQPLDEFLPAQITANRFGLLDITAGHALRVAQWIRRGDSGPPRRPRNSGDAGSTANGHWRR